MSLELRSRHAADLVDKDKTTLLGALGIAGRTSEGDHKLAILTARAAGYCTNFDTTNP